MKDNKITLDNKKYTVIFTFDYQDKTYYIYTDKKKDEDDFIKVCAGIYMLEDNKEYLLPIENDDDWDVIESLVEEFRIKIV